jgi:hypothetical protein
MLKTRMNANFLHAAADGSHRLPVVELKREKHIGLTIPPSVLATANRVIR